MGINEVNRCSIIIDVKCPYCRGNLIINDGCNYFECKICDEIFEINYAIKMDIKYKTLEVLNKLLEKLNTI